MKIIVEQVRYNKRGEQNRFPQTLYKGYRGRFYSPLFSKEEIKNLCIGIGFSLCMYMAGVYTYMLWR